MPRDRRYVSRMSTIVPRLATLEVDLREPMRVWREGGFPERNPQRASHRYQHTRSVHTLIRSLTACNALRYSGDWKLRYTSHPSFLSGSMTRGEALGNQPLARTDSPMHRTPPWLTSRTRSAQAMFRRGRGKLTIQCLADTPCNLPVVSCFPESHSRLGGASVLMM